MTTLVSEPTAIAVSFDVDNLWVQLSDGRQLGVPLVYFPRLAEATADQLKGCIISGGGIGLHWEELDEDISVPGLLAGRMDRTVRSDRPVKNAA